MIKQKVLDYILSGEGLISNFLRQLLYIYKKNRFMLDKNNSLELHNCYLAQTTIDVCGKQNRIVIKEGTSLHNCLIRIAGDNNTVTIGEGCGLEYFQIVVLDNNGEVRLGDKGCARDGMVASMEGRKVVIGNRFLFAYSCDIRSGDSHSILNNEGERTNPARNVFIGDNVWLGHGCSILKGAHIEHDSIVAAHSVVTKKFEEPHVIIGGSPAKVMRTGVSWLHERI